MAISCCVNTGFWGLKEHADVGLRQSAMPHHERKRPLPEGAEVYLR